ncbi:hypothetical protein H477_2056 [[Clostridium] sordellii ATCC 9714]|nr:hypothetical protein H477_2056 [[Clostridium] sordellii ATCC 9714] [Paeniclostridium sordellii ATCC 9714]
MLCIYKFKNRSCFIPPIIPVNIIATIVTDSIPPNVDVSEIPIGVVIDLPNNEFIINLSELVSLLIIIILINETTTPDVIPTIIS